MGHRALIAYQNAGTMDWESRYSHWGAGGAKLMGEPWEKKREGSDGHLVGRHGKRSVDTYQTLEDWAQDIDFLFHEAVYVVALDGEARAFDVLWWEGAQQYIPSPGGTQGVGAVIELEEQSEWGDYGNLFDEYDDVTAEEFHSEVKDKWGDRIPDWSPMGGDELRVPDDYLDYGNEQTTTQ